MKQSDDDVLAALAQMRTDNKRIGGKVWSTQPTRLTWQKDLQRAGVEYETADGTAFRSCLRTTFATHMYEAGVHIVDAAERMRHTDINLTRRYYTRARLANQQQAAEVLRRPVKKHETEQSDGSN